jgi:tetratricopeptide (TPR) repeat protein
MAGFIMVLLDGVPALLGERRGCALLAVALVVCLPLTWQRNALWNDPVAFYEDNLRVVPGSERAMIDLAFRYDEAGRSDDMRRLLEYAVRHRPKNHEFYNALAEDYANREGLEPALALLERGIALMPDNIELYERAALVAEQHGRPELVFGYLQRGLAAATSAKWRLLNDLGIYHVAAGDPAKAEQVYRQSLAINADNPVAYQYLGALYYRQGRAGDALAMLREANRLEPGNPETLEGMVKAARQAGDEATARWAAEKLRQAVDQRSGAGGGPP